MLTIEELKTLPKDDFIWLVKIKQPKLSCYCSNLSFTPKLFNALGNKHGWYCLRIEDYGTKWVAYRNKEESEGYYDQIRTETVKEILEKISHIKLNLNIEDFHTDNGILVHLLELEIHKAYEVMRDSSTKQIDEIAKEYGVEVKL